MDEKFEEYMLVSASIKKFEARKKALQAEIEAELVEGDEVKKDYGTFKMVSRTSYEYSEDLTKLEEDLKIRKTDEQEQKIAIPTTAWNLRFTSTKVK